MIFPIFLKFKSVDMLFISVRWLQRTDISACVVAEVQCVFCRMPNAKCQMHYLLAVTLFTYVCCEIKHSIIKVFSNK